MNEYIKSLIDDNKQASERINGLEETIVNFPIKNEKDKATFGNLCITLKGYRMVAESTEALLYNENVIKDNNGDFYQKIADSESTPVEKKDIDNSEKK